MKETLSRIEQLRKELLLLETPKAKQAEQIRILLAGNAHGPLSLSVDLDNSAK